MHFLLLLALAERRHLRFRFELPGQSARRLDKEIPWHGHIYRSILQRHHLVSCRSPDRRYATELLRYGCVRRLQPSRDRAVSDLDGQCNWRRYAQRYDEREPAAFPLPAPVLLQSLRRPARHRSVRVHMLLQQHPGLLR